MRNAFEVTAADAPGVPPARYRPGNVDRARSRRFVSFAAAVTSPNVARPRVLPSTNVNSAREPCRRFLAGRCFSTRCRFAHTLLECDIGFALESMEEEARASFHELVAVALLALGRLATLERGERPPTPPQQLLFCHACGYTCDSVPARTEHLRTRHTLPAMRAVGRACEESLGRIAQEEEQLRECLLAFLRDSAPAAGLGLVRAPSSRQASTPSVVRRLLCPSVSGVSPVSSARHSLPSTPDSLLRPGAVRDSPPSPEADPPLRVQTTPPGEVVVPETQELESSAVKGLSRVTLPSAPLPLSAAVPIKATPRSTRNRRWPRPATESVPAPPTPPLVKKTAVGGGPLSRGRGGNGNIPSDGDVERHPGPWELEDVAGILLALAARGIRIPTAHKLRLVAAVGGPQLDLLVAQARALTVDTPVVVAGARIANADVFLRAFRANAPFWQEVMDLHRRVTGTLDRDPSRTAIAPPPPPPPRRVTESPVELDREPSRTAIAPPPPPPPPALALPAVTVAGASPLPAIREIASGSQLPPASVDPAFHHDPRLMCPYAAQAVPCPRPKCRGRYLTLPSIRSHVQSVLDHHPDSLGWLCEGAGARALAVANFRVCPRHHVVCALSRNSCARCRIEGCDPLPAAQESPLDGAGSEVAPDPETAEATIEDIPSFEELAVLRVPLARRIPISAHAAITKCVAHCAAFLDFRPELAWHLLFAMPKLVLTRPPRHGGALDRQLRSKARDFCENRFAHLIHEARLCAFKEPVEEPVPEKILGELEGDDGYGSYSSTPLAAFPADVSDKQVRRAHNHAYNLGEYSRALSALNSMPLAPRTLETARKLQELHPVGPPVRIEAFEKFAVPEAFALLKLTRQFYRGSAAGMSGMTIQHIQDLLNAPDDRFTTAISRFVKRLIQGDLPPSVRPYWYGAQGYAFVKSKQMNIRPIGCGETLRRIAGKFWTGYLGERIGRYLMPEYQLGIGCKLGIDIAFHHIRRYREEMVRSEDFKVLMLIDVKNAFNTCDRQDFLDEVRSHFHEAYGYVAAAYAEATLIAYHVYGISCTRGGQQGDVLMPLLHALSLARSMRHARQFGMPEIERSIHDDITVGGSPYEIAQFFIGLCERVEVNLPKCLVVFSGPNREAAMELFPTLPADRFVNAYAEGFELLGAPIGPPCFVSGYCDKSADLAGQRISKITELAKHNKHAAFATLSMCCQTLNYLSRLVGPQPAWRRYDDIVARTADVILDGGTESDFTRDLLFLPPRHGGMGLRCHERHAFAAHLASLQDVQRSAFCKLHRLTESRDPHHDWMIGRLPLTINSIATGIEGGLLSEEDIPKIQRAYGKLIDKDVADARLITATDTQRITMKAASGKCAAAWIAPAIAVRSHWLTNPMFTVCARLRLALPIQPRSRCQHCLVPDKVDVFGHHSLACMHDGKRTLAHHRIVDCISAHMSTALWNPKLEARPFAGRRDIRVDIMTRGRLVPKELAIDVATISPYVTAHARHVLAGGGEAATAYGITNKLNTRYADVRRDPSYQVIPVVAEHLGSWGEPALRLFARLSAAIATVRNTSLTITRMQFMASLASTLQRSVASLLLPNQYVARNVPLDDYYCAKRSAT